MLPEIGLQGQDKLSNARILFIGAGGLACPAILYLAAAGIKQIGIIDGDIISLSNLHRQIIYGEQDLGLKKVDVIKQKIETLHPDCRITCYPEFLNEDNVESVFNLYDFIIDACDNIETRYLIERYCIKQNKVWIYGAITKYEGQIAVFNAGQSQEKRIQYSDLFPKDKEASPILSCSETGVLGTLPGIIGTMQANEAIKLITQIGNTYTKEMLVYNCLKNQFYKIEFPQ